MCLTVGLDGIFRRRYDYREAGSVQWLHHLQLGKSSETELKQLKLLQSLLDGKIRYDMSYQSI